MSQPQHAKPHHREPNLCLLRIRWGGNGNFSPWCVFMGTLTEARAHASEWRTLLRMAGEEDSTVHLVEYTRTEAWMRAILTGKALDQLGRHQL